MTLRGGERPSDGSRETTPSRRFDHTSDTGTLPMRRPMSRKVTEERSKASVGGLWPAFRVKQCTGQGDMTGSLRRIRHWSSRQTCSTWVPPARQRRGSASPGSGGVFSFEDHPPRALECTSQDQATRFPVELPRERVSRSRRCMNGFICSRRKPQESGASQRRLLRPLTICSGEPHVSRETT